MVGSDYVPKENALADATKAADQRAWTWGDSPGLPGWAHGDYKGPCGRKEAGRQDSAVRGTPPAVLALKVREGASGQWYALGTLQRAREQILP